METDAQNGKINQEEAGLDEKPQSEHLETLTPDITKSPERDIQAKPVHSLV